MGWVHAKRAAVKPLQRLCMCALQAEQHYSCEPGLEPLLSVYSDSCCAAVALGCMRAAKLRGAGLYTHNCSAWAG